MAWVTILVLLLITILLPFALFESYFNALGDWLLSQSRPMVALGIVAFLAGDIFLPIPSSVMSTASGAAFGFWLGSIVSWCGMNLACGLGYLLGYWLAPHTVQSMAGTDEMKRLHRISQDHGNLVLVLCRAVPVLAEASVLLAGMGHMSLGRFMLITSLTNLGISIAYSAVGASAVNYNSFILAFTGALIIPALAMLLIRRFR